MKKFAGVRNIMILLGDMLIIAIMAYIAVSIVGRYSEIQLEREVYNDMLPLMIIVAVILFNVNGLFSLAHKKYSEIIISLALAMINIFMIMMAISFFIREFSYSRSILLVAMFLQFIFLAIWKYLFWRIEKTSVQPHNALVIGNQEQCERIITRLENQENLRYRVKYACVECGIENWQAIAKDIDLIILCSDLKTIDNAEVIRFCHVHGKQVLIIPEFYELFCSNVDLDKIDDVPVFRPRDLKPTLEERMLKRILDVTFSLSVLLVLWPLFVIVALAVKFDSRGPIFYSQVRSGRNGTEFGIYKFRSMYQDAETVTGPVMSVENDHRITRVGRFLRATRLDELPQFINVLIGDMSVVGPRPERPFFVAQFEEEIHEYAYRHNVKPGITGLAQVYGKYNTTPRDKLIYDLIYIQKYNIITDLVIMVQTLQVLVSKHSTEGIKSKGTKTDLTKYQI